MKNFTCLFFAIVLVAVTNADAQIKKGSVFLGGNIGGSTQTTKRDGTKINDQSGLIVSPVFGKAIKENLVFGVDAGFSFFESNSIPNSGVYPDQKNSAYSAGVFIRKYKQIGKSNFLMFLQGSFGMNYSRNEYSTPIPNYYNVKRYSVGVSAYPGISYTISKRLQLETGFNNLISLSHFSEKRELPSNPVTIEKTSGVGVNTSLNNLASIYIGFRVMISK